MKKLLIALLVIAAITGCESKEVKEAAKAASAAGSTATVKEAAASETPEMSEEDLGYGDPVPANLQPDEEFNNGWEFHGADTRDPNFYDAVQKFGPTWRYVGKNDDGSEFMVIYSCGNGSIGSGFAIAGPAISGHYSKEHPYEFVITNQGQNIRRDFVERPEKYPTFDKVGNRLASMTTAGFKRYQDLNYNVLAEVNVGGIVDDNTGHSIVYTDPRRLVNGELGNRLAVQGLAFTETVTDWSHHDSVYKSYIQDPQTYQGKLMGLFEPSAIQEHIKSNTFSYKYNIPAVISDPAAEKYFKNGNICDLN
ncbi:MULTISPECIES: hypothetical protein [Neisseria]|uniref:Lipoprotein n=1 Tax=Neisseria mucosa C102 TaxID=435832 RepID=A0ABN0CDC3_NEIMU|nr:MULTISPECIES: hypothetical protein [Neisseria]EFV81339.1 hypothetical protein HMPREF0604_00424 [Neisseria mucosa C102]QKI21774.1 hypothetical protein FOC66_02470 [Neisseria mucosa]WNS83938.1 hypothetical protein RRV97_02045 [Neisseria sp. DTU_2021_1001991_1_SI_NGA_ILE_055]